MVDDERTSIHRRTLLRAAAAGAGVGLTGAGTVVGTDGPTNDALRRANTQAARGPRYVLDYQDEFSETLRRTIETFPGIEQCVYPNADREIYGPTDVNAQTANGGLAVAFNDRGTMTVCKWPNPSYYDHVKYFAEDRSADHYGAAPNEGAFLGLAVETTEGTETAWLREWETTQHHPEGLTDVVVTEHRSDHFGLTVTVEDVVDADEDVLVRDVTVERDDDSPVEKARLLAFENLSLNVSKLPFLPVTDACLEEGNADFATYDRAVDAIVHARQGVDVSTGEQASVAVGMGFREPSTDHQVGGDAFESASTPDEVALDAGSAVFEGLEEVPESGPLTGAVGGLREATYGNALARDAYLDASESVELAGNDSYLGQTTGVLSRVLSFEGDTATATVYFAAGANAAAVGERLGSARERDPAAIRGEKRAWLEGVLSDAPMPDTDDEDILALCRRALVTLATTYDPDSGTIVASIATQSPYGEDWPRDGAYFNHLLEAIGRHDWVEKHNRFYVENQQSVENPQLPDLVPPGNWAMNYYADGVPGGPIPYEIDETGYGIWTLWDHYDATGDEAYLREVYPAIKRAADYLVDCVDPETGLHCPAWEDDRPMPQQTAVGALTVWLGLDSARKAADALGRSEDRTRWTVRRNELAEGIEAECYDEATGYGAKAGFTFAETVWPVGYRPEVGSGDGTLDHPRIENTLDREWAELETTFAEPEAGERDGGLYESKGLLALAKARRTEGPGSIDDVRDGLRWVATEHATEGTHVLGEVWMAEENDDGEREIVSAVSQPHVWEQSLFYLAALEAWPPEGLEFDADSLGGVIEALRERNAPGQS